MVSEITAPDALWTRAHELAAIIAAKADHCKRKVRCGRSGNPLDMPRGAALANALKYTQLGKSAGDCRARDRPRRAGPQQAFQHPLMGLTIIL